MHFRNVVLPTKAAEQLAGLPAGVRVYVEAYLENLDVLVGHAPMGRISMLWEKLPEAGNFIAHVEGVRLFIAFDGASGLPIIRRIDPPLLPGNNGD
ncbi:MAG TPA: hypothetical protein VK539_06155 [Myxococcaceae bacterium]|nr:hypothetical protein [Myxococcaceae bacterium]